jgi:hypothetical protein
MAGSPFFVSPSAPFPATMTTIELRWFERPCGKRLKKIFSA